MSDTEPTKVITMERHVQTVLVSIIVGLLTWVGTGITASRTDIARLEEKVVSLQTQVSKIENSKSNQYYTQDAVRDFAIRDAQIKELQRRLDKVEDHK